LPYDTDGVVFGINSLTLHTELGYTAHHPRYRIAFKFARERGETTVVGINWNTSRTGRVVPQIEMKPISLGGAVVTFTTGHNAKNIKDLNLGAGDKILMEREVIPYLVSKIDGSGPAKIPTKCNSCNTALVWDETGVDVACPNMGGCPAQLQSYLEHYVARKVVNIMGVGSTLIEKLIAAKLVKSPADLYRLSETQLKSGVARQGESSAEKIVKAIQDRREQDLATFLYSLGIPSLGNTISEKLAERFGTLQAILSASEADFKMDKIGDKLASSIFEGLHLRKNLIIDLTKEVRLKTIEKIEGGLTGQSFCLTGHVEFDYNGKHYESRPDIEDLLKSKGAAIKSSVSKDLTYLVAGDEAGSKLEKAQKTGIKILDGAALVSLVKMLG
jgi:DNA ligase (NAD+)